MATAPVITGAPARANVIPFPLSQAARLRGRIVRSPNLRALDRAIADLKTAERAGRVSGAEFVELVAASCATNVRIRLAGGR